MGYIENKQLPIVAVTRPPKQHFFGYYTNDQFDLSGRYLLSLECDIIGRLQREDDIATLGIVDLGQKCNWRPLVKTAAWNWQMGCMAQWLPGKPHQIIYNDRRASKLVSVIRDVTGGEKHVLPNPIYELAPDGRSALTLNFARLWDVRPETGYPGVKDPWMHRFASDEDGVFRMDLDTGKTTQIISHADMTGFPPTQEMPSNAKRYFTHLLFNEDGTRFMFWYRCHCSQVNYYSGLYTASPHGKDIFLVTRYNSHSVWLGQDKILAWAAPDKKKPRTWLFTDQKDDVEIMGKGLLDFNGHATLSPDNKWLITVSLR